MEYLRTVLWCNSITIKGGGGHCPKYGVLYCSNSKCHFLRPPFSGAKFPLQSISLSLMANRNPLGSITILQFLPSPHTINGENVLYTFLQPVCSGVTKTNGSSYVWACVNSKAVCTTHRGWKTAIECGVPWNVHTTVVISQIDFLFHFFISYSRDPHLHRRVDPWIFCWDVNMEVLLYARVKC